MAHLMRTLAAAAAAVTVVSGTAGIATAQTLSPDHTAAVSCIGTSFSGTLGVNKALCNSGYRLTMQDNGDLVLRRSNGSACYASGTRAPGDASATFVQDYVAPPHVNIESTSQGNLGTIWGANRLPHVGTNANLNSKGEFWIGYKKIGYC
ncbi:hypothetical protein [Streptomyces qinglanensis]|uniref:hypothetical protein n=1 Tax=Streptomyces qinglanensis TaxID=943816 RepID=UPI003D729157